MNYRELGRSGVKVSEISFGCWTMGGLNWVNGVANGWAEVDEEEITRGIKAALDAGVNHFDNADVYGNGRAERMLARVLKKLGVKSESVVIATKVGWFPGTAGHAYEPGHIRQQCEQSLINLGREYVDVYYFHHGDFGKEWEYLEPAAEVMDRLVKEGKVRVKGQSAYSAGDFERAAPVVRPASRVQKLMEEWEMTFVAFSPLAQGRLLDKFDAARPPVFEAGDHRLGKEAFSSEAIAKLAPKLEKLKGRFGGTVEDLAGVALNYVLAMPRVACVIPGFRNERQARCNLARVGRGMSEEEVEFVRGVLGGE
ncbi:MAG TPA: aldo/keto reductase [Tepidisphaeraceae bacterium]|jgi:aryl-alcohol dehydrogenase-like predicted oxidoreductase|nr:aldo/keto reductase [Tepidisphaeraceae bacterium]